MDDEQFLEIIKQTPLVSIDLILEDGQGKILLGKRLNRPAQGYWFVPGGRIRKNETIAEAMQRISRAELGWEISMPDTRLLGAYNHFYSDNYLARDGIGTHYVVLAYKVMVPAGISLVPDAQHCEIDWWTKQDLLEHRDVHANTKAYFTAG